MFNHRISNNGLFNKLCSKDTLKTIYDSCMLISDLLSTIVFFIVILLMNMIPILLVKINIYLILRHL